MSPRQAEGAPMRRLGGGALLALAAVTATEAGLAVKRVRQHG